MRSALLAVVLTALGIMGGLYLDAYYAKADGEGVLVRGFIENDVEDIGLLYRRDSSKTRDAGYFYVQSSFGRSNLSFMSQVELPDGTIKSFPTMVYEIVGGAGSEREAAERWFGYVDEVMIHFSGGDEDFASLYRPYSQTPYTPKPGEFLIVREAGSGASTGLTTSAFRSMGLKAEQFLSPKNGYRTGAVEVDGEWYYHEGNSPLAQGVLPMCVFFVRTLEEIENQWYGPSCE